MRDQLTITYYYQVKSLLQRSAFETYIHFQISVTANNIKPES